MRFVWMETCTDCWETFVQDQEWWKIDHFPQVSALMFTHSLGVLFYSLSIFSCSVCLMQQSSCVIHMNLNYLINPTDLIVYVI